MSDQTEARGRRRAHTSPRLQLHPMRALVQLGGIGLAIVVALWPLWPVYDHPSFYAAVIGATIGGLIVALLGALFRWNALAVTAAGFVTLLVLGVPLAVPGRAIAGVLPSTQGLVDLLAGLALSWKQLLTIALPVGPYQALLVPPFVLALASAIVAGSLVLRIRHTELAVIAPIVVFVLAILWGPTAANAPVEIALVLFVICLALVLYSHYVRRRSLLNAAAQTRAPSGSDRRTRSASALAIGAAMVAASLALGTAATVLIPPTQGREVLRSDIRAPFDPRDFSSPLASFRSEMRAPRADEVLLTVTGLPDGVRLRLAALNSYDGIVYSVGGPTGSSASGDFTRLPYRLDQSQVEGERLRLNVSVGELGGVWVPGVGPLESMRFTGEHATARDDAFYYNDAIASAAVLPGLASGDLYTSLGVAVPEIAANRIAALAPGTAVLPENGVDVDGVTEALERWTRSNDAPGSQLAAVIAGLTSEGYISHGVGPGEPPSRSGHGADRITELLTSDPMIGDGEQYAVAAALLARELGFPARVVVGFLPSEPHQAADAVQLRGGDSAAWIEVQDARQGWVAIDPNPPLRDIPERQPDDPLEISRPQSVVPPPVHDRPEDRDPPAPDTAQDEDSPQPDPFLQGLLVALTVAGWSVLGLAVALAPFVIVIVAKVRRRRKRRGASHPLARLEGGWREVADSVADRGIVMPPLATRREQALVVTDAVGAQSPSGRDPLALASLVDRAHFAPEEPSNEQADEAWLAIDALRGDLRTGQSRWQRLRALVSLRSFTRYAGGAKEGVR